MWWYIATSTTKRGNNKEFQNKIMYKMQECKRYILLNKEKKQSMNSKLHTNNYKKIKLNSVFLGELH
jgi:hypothetical protein